MCNAFGFRSEQHSENPLTMIERIAGQRARHNHEQNQDYHPIFTPQTPRLSATYGKRNKKLSRTVHRFKRASIFNIPVADDVQHLVLDKVGAPGIEPDAEASPLSESQLEAVYGRHVDAINASPCNSALPISRRKTILHMERYRAESPRFGSTIDSNGVAMGMAGQTQSPGWRGERKGLKRRDSDAACNTSKRIAKTISKQCKPRQFRSRRPNLCSERRLPVNDLILVPGEENSKVDELRSTSLTDGKTVPASRYKLPKAPCRPKLTHKSVNELQRKKSSETKSYQKRQGNQDFCDGFSSSEMEIMPRLTTKMRRHNKQRPPILGSASLCLQKGPLPAVSFQRSIEHGGVEHCGPSALVLTEKTNHEQDIKNASTLPNVVQEAHVKISCQNTARSDKVWAELSSMSAPKRVYSVSTDGSEDIDFVITDDEGQECTIDEDCTEIDDESTREGSEDSECDKHFTPFKSGQSASRCRSTRSETRFCPDDDSVSSAKHTHSSGMTLKLKRLLPLGKSPSWSPLKKQSLMELNETIIDKAEPSALGRPTQQSHHLSNAIVPTPSNVPSATENQHVNQLINSPPSPPPFPARHRSILRRTDSNLQSTNTSPHHTASNTRRNSLITLNNQHESCYFATAANTLHTTNSQDHRNTPASIAPRRRITAHRSSQLRADYLARMSSTPVDDHDDGDGESESETSHDDNRVCQNSPDQLGSLSNADRVDYIDRTQLDVLRSKGNVTWIGKEQPVRRVQRSRDLKMLTRRISREHGTLSQGVDEEKWSRGTRRDSLVFRSPVVVT